MSDQKKSNFFSKVTEHMKQTINPGAFSEVGKDISDNLQTMVSNHMTNKMNLVTREDYDNLYAVLMHTRERLETVENKLAALEALLKDQQQT
ncbi:MAG: accessory factor UbiK family protein [Endozoicomonadaceae bacterium]|nr:accessory factor UbiK family protein [Endozoicomonadaceae bacterium]MCY4330591.1 accessory factor UbiK family protein [Endozoicomonadaceae bacterium]